MSHSNSIWRANSRDLCRSVMLTAFSAAGIATGVLRRLARQFASQLTRQLRHLDSGEPRFESLVAAFEPRAINGLFERVAGEHAKRHGHARIELRELNAARCFRGNVIVMRGLAAQDASDTDDGVAAAGGGEFLRGDGKFERARHAHDFNLLLTGARAFERVERTGEEPIGDEAVELAHNDAKVKAGGIEAASRDRGFEILGHGRRQRPRNFAGRFSINARVPSCMSSVAQHSPNKADSRKRPSSW